MNMTFERTAPFAILVAFWVFQPVSIAAEDQGQKSAKDVCAGIVQLYQSEQYATAQSKLAQLKPDQLSLQQKIWVFDALSTLGFRLFARGHKEQSIAPLKTAVEIGETVPENHKLLITPLGLLSQAYTERGSFNEAEGTLRRKLELERTFELPKQDTLKNLAVLCEKLGQPEEAARCLRELKSRKQWRPTRIEHRNLPPELIRSR